MRTSTPTQPRENGTADVGLDVVADIVRDEPQPEPRAAARGHRVDGARNRLVLHIPDAVEVDEERADVRGRAHRIRRPISCVS